MKLNRRLLMVLALVMSLAMATTGTLAFLTDRDTVENTFTMGNVDIEVEEEFEQGSDLTPGVEVEKKAGITNTHKTEPAYVWMTVSVPKDLDQAVTLKWAEGVTAEKLTESVHDGYVSYLVKHPDVLEPGASTPKYLESVTLSEKVDYQDGKYVLVDGGEVTDLGDLSKVDIIVDGFAMQTEGMADVEAAYTAYTAQWKGLNGGESVPGGAGEGGEEEKAYGDDDTVTYDIPEDAYRVTNSAELEAAVNSGKTTLRLAAGEYTDLAATAGKNLKLYGESKDAILYTKYNGGEGADYDFDGSTVEFYGLTISDDKYSSTANYYPGYARMNATYNDCVIEGMYVLYGKSEFNYCTLDITGDQYNIWTWGAGEAKFDHCTFNTDGKSVLVYNSSCDLTVSNCLFNDSEALAPVKAAIETGADNKDAVYHNINVTNTKVNGFAVNTTNCADVTTTLWANKNGMDKDHLNVVVDGVDVY